MRLTILVTLLMLLAWPVLAAEQDESLDMLEGLQVAVDGEHTRIEQFLMVKKVLRPSFYADLICQETNDPFLRKLFAVKLVKESGGKASAVSCRGALGPWQVMPGWAKVFHVSKAKLREPRTNLQIALKVYKVHLADSRGKVWGNRGAVALYSGMTPGYQKSARIMLAQI